MSLLLLVRRRNGMLRAVSVRGISTENYRAPGQPGTTARGPTSTLGWEFNYGEDATERQESFGKGRI